MELWTPGQAKDVVEVPVTQVMNVPNVAKKEGGSYFDDELETAADVNKAIVRDMEALVAHLRERPDHTVYVGGSKEREQLRVVFNHWKKTGVINYNPNIRIDYGVPDGAIRVDE